MKMHKVYETSETVNLVFEFLSGGDLKKKVVKRKALSEKCALLIMSKILKGVAFLHANKIVHRDLKPDNIFLMKEENGLGVKIADFGLSCRFDAESAVSKIKCGTPGYMAPEIISHKQYDEKVDIYSCGVLLYFMYPCCYTNSLGFADRFPLKEKRAKK